MIFFPNLILHIFGYIYPRQELRANDFSGTLELTPYITSRTLLIGFFLHASLGYISAFVKEKVEYFKHTKAYILTTKEIPSINIYHLLIPALLFAFGLHLDLINIEPYKLFYLIPLYISFYYGFHMAYYNVLLVLILFSIHFNPFSRLIFGP